MFRPKEHGKPGKRLHLHGNKALVMGNCCSSSFPGAEYATRIADNKSAERRMTPAPQLAGGFTPMARGPSTYPRCTRLADGSLLGAHTLFENGQNVLAIVRSTDNGLSWYPWGSGEAARKPSAEHDLDNAFLLQLPSGKVLIACRDHDRRNFGEITVFRITVCQSDDNGQNWTFLSTAAHDPGPVTGVWEPFMRNTTDNQVQLYYARENQDKSQNCLLVNSADQGRTWSRPVEVANGYFTKVRHGMMGVCETDAPSHLFAVMETGAPGGFYLSSVTSTNDGRSWSTPRQMFNPGRGRNANAPQVVNMGGGLLVCSFMTDQDGGPTATKVITSHDMGKTWSNKIVVGQAESKWPGIYAVEDRAVIVLHEQAGGPGAVVQRVMLQ